VRVAWMLVHVADPVGDPGVAFLVEPLVVVSGWPLTCSTGERSEYSIHTDSTATPLCASASATRSTLVEKGAR
jgi:hypothetical protein